MVPVHVLLRYRIYYFSECVTVAVLLLIHCCYFNSCCECSWRCSVANIGVMLMYNEVGVIE